MPINNEWPISIMPGRNHWRTRARSVFLLAVFRLKPHHFCCCRRHTNLVNSNRMIESRPITKALSCGLWSPKKSPPMQTSYPLYPALLEGGMLLVPPSLSLSSHDVCSLEKTSFSSFLPRRYDAHYAPTLFMSTSTALEYEARHTD
jgi:hypothetical protein